RPARARAELRARTARHAWRAVLLALTLVGTVLAPPKKGARQVPWGWGGGGGHPGLTAELERPGLPPPKSRGAPARVRLPHLAYPPVWRGVRAELSAKSCLPSLAGNFLAASPCPTRPCAA